MSIYKKTSWEDIIMRLIDAYQQHVGDLLYKVRTTQRETIEKALKIDEGSEETAIE